MESIFLVTIIINIKHVHMGTGEGGGGGVNNQTGGMVDSTLPNCFIVKTCSMVEVQGIDLLTLNQLGVVGATLISIEHVVYIM